MIAKIEKKIAPKFSNVDTRKLASPHVVAVDIALIDSIDK